MRPADLGALVPVEAEPAEAVQDRLQRLGHVALLVGVVDAQDELAAVLAGEQPVEQGRADAADVQIAGRAGGETRADHWQRFRSEEGDTVFPGIIGAGGNLARRGQGGAVPSGVGKATISALRRNDAAPARWHRQVLRGPRAMRGRPLDDEQGMRGVGAHLAEIGLDHVETAQHTTAAVEVGILTGLDDCRGLGAQGDERLGGGQRAGIPGGEACRDRERRGNSRSGWKRGYRHRPGR